MENKINPITNLFEGKEIRSVWDKDIEDYYFSVIDVIVFLTDSTRARKYWNDLKNKLVDEGSQLSDKIGQLKLKSKKDGKYYTTDVLDTKGILRLIESIPSPKAEPFKLWLANLGSERIDEVFDPEKAINRAIDYYLKLGKDPSWITCRIGGILDRKRLTDTWKEGGITKESEYAILTNEIYKECFDMNKQEYKEFKNIRKESLRDNMNDYEIMFTNIGENITREVSKDVKPFGLDENIKVAKVGGKASKAARKVVEENLGKSTITKNNYMNYQYIKNSEKDK